MNYPRLPGGIKYFHSYYRAWNFGLYDFVLFSGSYCLSGTTLGLLITLASLSRTLCSSRGIRTRLARSRLALRRWRGARLWYLRRRVPIPPCFALLHGNTAVFIFHWKTSLFLPFLGRMIGLPNELLHLVRLTSSFVLFATWKLFSFALSFIRQYLCFNGQFVLLPG